MVTISVIMPVYNGEKFLRDAIDSILVQSFGDFEFIIINDGSTDDSEKIILSYKDRRIVYVKNDVNLKLIKTLNKGVAIARGKYIARMDADDVSLPSRFDTQLKYFNQHPDVGIVNGRSLYLYLSGQIKKPPFYCSIEETHPLLQPFENTICHPAVMLVSDLLKKNNYKDDGTALHIEDWELWLRLYSKGVKCITTNEYLLHYRITEGSINRMYNDVQIDNMSKLSIAYLKNQLSFEINYKTLRYIMGDKSDIIPLREILMILKCYLNQINVTFNVSVAATAEIESWIYLYCLKDLKYKFQNNKKAFARDFLFFLIHSKHNNVKKISFK
ncbi:glycosyltransferase family 2 protein [Pedobacter frigiditerrae]|uniref:glycosyltransferase family 2 protein n=1 Tax=Pedobacter frigiditerrae TaxID=2530452 RepID=UPI00292F1021|nr:glycosyltransferase [Pedobacter frigiditerrae]